MENLQVIKYYSCLYLKAVTIMLNQSPSNFFNLITIYYKKNIINKMELINRNDVSLGLTPFDILGFKSEEELNIEISKLIKTRSEFDIKTKVNFI